MNGLRSENSPNLCLRFINASDKFVDIIWINCRGQYHVYATLKPQDFLDVNTFTKHYWLFQENKSQAPLVANNKWHFCGEESGYPPFKSLSKRHPVFISRPTVAKLRTICINFLCNSEYALKHCSDVKHLEIPVTLKKDIIRKIHSRDLHSHISPEDHQKCENNLNYWRDFSKDSNCIERLQG